MLSGRGFEEDDLLNDESRTMVRDIVGERVARSSQDIGCSVIISISRRAKRPAHSWVGGMVHCAMGHECTEDLDLR